MTPNNTAPHRHHRHTAPVVRGDQIVLEVAAPASLAPADVDGLVRAVQNGIVAEQKFVQRTTIPLRLEPDPATHDNVVTDPQASRVPRAALAIGQTVALGDACASPTLQIQMLRPPSVVAQVGVDGDIDR